MIKNLVRALSYSERLNKKMIMLTERYEITYLSFLIVNKHKQFAYVSSDSLHVFKLFNENRYNGLAKYFFSLIKNRDSTILDLISVDKNKDDQYMKYFFDKNFKNIFTQRLDTKQTKFDRIYSVIAFKNSSKFDKNDVIMLSKNIFQEVSMIKNKFFLEKNNIECLPFVDFKAPDTLGLNEQPLKNETVEIVSEFEKKIFSFLMSGMTHSQIASALSISTAKVYSMLYKLTKEYNFSSPYSMAVYLMQYNLI